MKPNSNSRNREVITGGITASPKAHDESINPLPPQLPSVSFMPPVKELRATTSVGVKNSGSYCGQKANRMQPGINGGSLDCSLPKDKLMSISPKNNSLMHTLLRDDRSPAGLNSERLTTELDRYNLVTQKIMRKYTDIGERDRKIHYTHMQIKDNSFYNKRDSLWNEP